jgi:glutamate-1-semialdehyde 2,1-aminomutase
MMTLFFTPEHVTGYKSATSSDTKKFAQYFNSMLQQGIYLPPAQFEALFVSSVHSQEDLDATIRANYQAISGL